MQHDVGERKDEEQKKKEKFSCLSFENRTSRHIPPMTHVVRNRSNSSIHQQCSSTMRVLSTAARAATALSMTASNTTYMSLTTSSMMLNEIPPFDPLKAQRRIFLLRHGETDWNQRGLMQGGGFDIELNDSGKQQAEMLAQELIGIKNHGIGVVASSHLQRAKQTADILHNTLQQQQVDDDFSLIHQVVCMPEFGEMRFGWLEGTALRGPESTKESRNLFQTENAKMSSSMDYSYPGGGESVRCVETRAKRGVEMLYEQHPEVQAIAIVAHGRLNKILLASLLYNDALQYPAVHQSNTCINVIDYCHDGTYEEVILSYMDHIIRQQ